MIERQTRRLSAGGRIDRSNPIPFLFNGRKCTGYSGDTVASALLANGVSTVSRSPVHHRARGIYGAGADDPNRVDIYQGGEPLILNAAPTLIGLEADMDIRSSTGWPGTVMDIGAVASLVPNLLAGNPERRTLKSPFWGWQRVFRPVLQRWAGGARLPKASEQSRFETSYSNYDTVIVGAGPSGLMAAQNAARDGLRVLIVEQLPAAGGCLHWLDCAIDGVSGVEWSKAVLERLQDLDNVTIRLGAQAIGFSDDRKLLVAEPAVVKGGGASSKLRCIDTATVLLCTGAREESLLFAGNDRPGIMLASAARAYLHEYGVAPGRRAVCFTNHDEAYRAAFDLQEAGVEIAAIVDVRRNPRTSLPERARESGIPCHFGSVITRALGRLRVDGVRIAHRVDERSGRDQVACDLVCVSGGWQPDALLYRQSGGKMSLDPESGMVVPGGSQNNVRCVGGAAGEFGINGCLQAGQEAAEWAVTAVGKKVRRRTGAVRAVFEQAVEIEPLRSGDVGVNVFVDPAADLTSLDVVLVEAEGRAALQAVPLLQNWSSGGGSIAASESAVMALSKDVETVDVGASPSPPFPAYPVALSLLAGREVRERQAPIRRLPAARLYERHGAVFEPREDWQVPVCFRHQGEAELDAIARETRSAISNLVLADLSHWHLKPAKAEESSHRRESDLVDLGDFAVRCRCEPPCGRDEGGWFEEQFAHLALIGPDACAFLATVFDNEDIRNLDPGRSMPVSFSGVDIVAHRIDMAPLSRFDLFFAADYAEALVECLVAGGRHELSSTPEQAVATEGGSAAEGEAPDGEQPGKILKPVLAGDAAFDAAMILGGRLPTPRQGRHLAGIVSEGIGAVPQGALVFGGPKPGECYLGKVVRRILVQGAGAGLALVELIGDKPEEKEIVLRSPATGGEVSARLVEPDELTDHVMKFGEGDGAAA